MSQYKSANPLFEQWLTEWHEKAKKENSKLRFTYKNALISLRKYPLPLKNGKECYILRGFGKEICRKLDEKLKLVGTSEVKRQIEDKRINEISEEKKSVDNADKNDYLADKELEIVLRQPEKLIVIDLDEENIPSSSQNLRKLNESNQQIDANKLNCEASENDFKFKNGDYLTDSELEVFLKQIEKTNIPSFKQISNQQKTDEELIENVETRCIYDDYIFKPGEYEIILIVDTQEAKRNKKYTSIDETSRQLEKLGVDFEIRHMSVGDFSWVARNKSTRRELILPFIVERKRMDDFGKSIKDGRYREQKFRLMKSEMSNIIYLIENYKTEHAGLPIKTLHQAALNTAIHNGFLIKYTLNHSNTMIYLSMVTNQLKEIFSRKILSGCSKQDLINVDINSDQVIPALPFDEFNSQAKKKRKYNVKETFIRQLIKIRGVSIEKAMAITEKYPSPKSLQIAYMNNGENLLSRIRYGKSGKFIGANISKIIFMLFSNQF